MAVNKQMTMVIESKFPSLLLEEGSGPMKFIPIDSQVLRLQMFNKNINSLYKFVLIDFRDERKD